MYQRSMDIELTANGTNSCTKDADLAQVFLRVAHHGLHALIHYTALQQEAWVILSSDVINKHAERIARKRPWKGDVCTMGGLRREGGASSPRPDSVRQVHTGQLKVYTARLTSTNGLRH